MKDRGRGRNKETTERFHFALQYTQFEGTIDTRCLLSIPFEGEVICKPRKGHNLYIKANILQISSSKSQDVTLFLVRTLHKPLNVSLKYFWLTRKKTPQRNGCRQTLQQMMTGLQLSMKITVWRKLPLS